LRGALLVGNTNGGNFSERRKRRHGPLELFRAHRGSTFFLSGPFRQPRARRRRTLCGRACVLVRTEGRKAALLYSHSISLSLSFSSSSRMHHLFLRLSAILLTVIVSRRDLSGRNPPPAYTRRLRERNSGPRAPCRCYPQLASMEPARETPARPGTGFFMHVPTR